MALPPILVLLANLIPVVSVFLFGWSALELLMLYWLENVIVGVVNLLKIVVTSFTSRYGWAGLFVGPFFVFHYGLFCAVHGVFIWAMCSIAAPEALPAAADPFVLPTLVVRLMADQPSLFWNALALGALHLAAFGLFWVGQGQWRDADPFSQMFEPYGRVIVLHMTIFFAAIPVLLLGQPLIAVALLALLKTAVETGRWNVSTRVEHAEVRAAMDEAMAEWNARKGGNRRP